MVQSAEKSFHEFILLRVTKSNQNRMPREQGKHTKYFPSHSPGHKQYEIPQNKGEFYVISNPY